MCRKAGRGGKLNLALKIFLIINSVFLLLFVLGRGFVFNQVKNPNLQAGYALLLGVFFLPYFFMIAAIVLFSIFRHEFLPVGLAIFIFLPFLIGQKATYEKLNFYSNIQLASFLASAAFTFVLLKHF